MLQLHQQQPSRVFTYKLDQWFWSHPASKLILLSSLTVTLITCGGVSLYLASHDEMDPSDEPTLGDAMWAAVAGAGRVRSFLRHSSSHLATFL
jgi:hypothetical protein